MAISSDNKRIAKNTLMLYLKMGLTMLVSLYTSRVVLQTLGVDDFGIYNVVGGVVILFSFLNAAMSSATQRFLNFELGKGDLAQVGRVFSMSLSVHFCIAGLVLLLAETVGLWFLNSELNIPVDRMVAANWVYQFSVATTLLGILLVPYNATIIAYERMVFYAWASIATVLLRLGIVYLLVIGNFDKLILYAILTFAVSVVMQIITVSYCRRSFSQTTKYKPFRDKALFKELMSFSGWNLFGGISYLGNTQGLNMVLNIFCGVGVNAAMGVANQVVAAVQQFSSSFQAAFNPQIVKKFAAGQCEATELLIFRASRISFALVLFLVVPIFSNADYILHLWLGIVPEYAVPFVRLTLLYCLTEALSAPLFTLVSATGKIREYQVIVGFMFLVNVPLACVLLWGGLSPEWVIASRLGITLLMIPARMLIARKHAGLHLLSYSWNVLIRVFILGTIVFIPPLLLAKQFSPLPALIVSGAISFVLVVFTGWFLCFSSEERSRIVSLVGQRFFKFEKVVRILRWGAAISFVGCVCVGGFVFSTLPKECASECKVAHVSIDDCWKCLDQLSDPAVESIYDVPFFALLRDWNEKYGAKFTCYVYGSVDGVSSFRLCDVPNKFRPEFEEASSWLRFGFHAMEVDIAKTHSLTKESFEENLKKANKSIDGFAGIISRSSILRLDYFFSKEEWSIPLRELGVTTLLGPDTDGRLAYALSRNESEILWKRGEFQKEGCMYIRSDVRYENVLWTWWTFSNLRDEERIVAFTHEWAMDRWVQVQMEASFRWLQEHGYEFIF